MAFAAVEMPQLSYKVYPALGFMGCSADVLNSIAIPQLGWLNFGSRIYINIHAQKGKRQNESLTFAKLYLKLLPQAFAGYYIASLNYRSEDRISWIILLNKFGNKNKFVMDVSYGALMKNLMISGILLTLHSMIHKTQTNGMY